MLRPSHNRFAPTSQRRPASRGAVLAAAGIAVLALAALAAAPASGPAAVAGSRLAVTVRLTDRGCIVPPTVLSRSLRIRVVNRGRYVH